jgi:cyanophycin synthetase
VLAEQGFAVDSIPPAGHTVLIRRNANLSTGGTATDVTDLVHPEVAARAIEAAKMIGLDIAGVDVVCQDLSRPLEEQGGVIVEVNAAPGLRMHAEPSTGQSRPVGQAIISTMFAEGQNGRIPVVAVTGVNGKTTTTRFIAHLVRQTGRRVGMTCTEGVYLDDRRLESGDCSGPNSAQKLLSNPYVEAAVLETARGGILRSGLAFDRCDVAVVTNIGEGDHLGLNDIETLEKLARVKRVPVEAVSEEGAAVLNAADPLVAEMATRCKGNVVFFARDAENVVIQKHRLTGGRAVVVREHTIMLVEGDCEIPLLPINRVPLTHEGRIGFQVENTLAAVGAAWSLGLTREVIRAGLETFSAGIDHVPGRFNLLEVNGGTVVVDYGHNTSSLAAMFEALENFPHKQRVAVYTVAGDRRDIDMIRQGELLGNAFDRVILYEDHYVRGRQPGEIMSRLREGLAKGRRVQNVEEVYGAVKAIDMALESLLAGELMLLQADTVDETVAYVRQYLDTHRSARQINLQQAIAAAQGRVEGSVVQVVLANGYTNGHAGGVHANGNGHGSNGHAGNGYSSSVHAGSAHASSAHADNGHASDGHSRALSQVEEVAEAAIAVALAD